MATFRPPALAEAARVGFPLQAKEAVLIEVFRHRVMDECPCSDYFWAVDWLSKNGHIAAMLAGGWTLETVKTMDIDAVSDKMAIALWKRESMREPVEPYTALVPDQALLGVQLLISCAASIWPLPPHRQGTCTAHPTGEGWTPMAVVKAPLMAGVCVLAGL